MNQSPSCLVGRCWQAALCLLGQPRQDTFMVDPRLEKLKKRSSCSTDGVLILRPGSVPGCLVGQTRARQQRSDSGYNGPS